MEILNGKVYRHFKGGYVLVISTAKHSDRDEIEVVYKGLNNGKIYARPMDSFVELVKNSEDKDVSRFALATDEEVSQILSTDDFKLVQNMTAFIEKEPNIKNI
ncbi:MAG: DUF1653 domain-containing protein [Clostridia bacterium]|nr:DUF1653 domain-containing protein [Clostridia bacterium]